LVKGEIAPRLYAPGGSRTGSCRFWLELGPRKSSLHLGVTDPI